jgi:hypothetical protein
VSGAEGDRQCRAVGRGNLHADLGRRRGRLGGRRDGNRDRGSVAEAKVSVWPVPVSVPASCNGVMAVPGGPACVPGLVTVRVFAAAQANVAVAELVPSVAVIVVVALNTAVTLPVIAPLVVSIVTPAGSGAAL